MNKEKSAFKTDVEKYYFIKYGTRNPSFFGKLFMWITNYGLHCTAIYRFGKFAKKFSKTVNSSTV